MLNFQPSKMKLVLAPNGPRIDLLYLDIIMRRLLSGRIQRQILRSLKYDSTKADLSFRHGLPVITVTLPSRKGSRPKI